MPRLCATLWISICVMGPSFLQSMNHETTRPHTQLVMQRLAAAWSIEERSLPRWVREISGPINWLGSNGLGESPIIGCASNPHREHPIFDPFSSIHNIIEYDANEERKPTQRSDNILDTIREAFEGDTYFGYKETEVAPPLRPVEHVAKGIIHKNSKRVKDHVSPQHVNSYFPYNNMSLLHMSTLLGFTQGCRALIDTGANPHHYGHLKLIHTHFPSVSGYMTPLHIAAYYGYSGILHELTKNNRISMDLVKANLIVESSEHTYFIPHATPRYIAEQITNQNAHENV